MDVDSKAQLYPSTGLDGAPLGHSPPDIGTQPQVPPSDAATALAHIRWIASLGPTAAAQIPREILQNTLVTFAAGLPPLNQQVLATFLQGNSILDLSTEDMYILAYEISSAWQADGGLNTAS